MKIADFTMWINTTRAHLDPKVCWWYYLLSCIDHLESVDNLLADPQQALPVRVLLVFLREENLRLSKNS